MAIKRSTPPTITDEPPQEPANKKQVVEFDHSIQETLDHILSQFKAREQSKKSHFEKWLGLQSQLFIRRKELISRRHYELRQNIIASVG